MGSRDRLGAGPAATGRELEGGPGGPVGAGWGGKGRRSELRPQARWAEGTADRAGDSVRPPCGSVGCGPHVVQATSPPPQPRSAGRSNGPLGLGASV